MGITTRNLRIGYHSDHGDITVASGICAEVRSGELTSLAGPNGSGKSTLLRTLSGAQAPLAGEVSVEGTPLTALSAARLARLVSVVLTERIDLPNMTVREAVALGRTPYTGFFGRLSSRDHEITDAAITTVGISHLADRRISTLSDGERQKAMIAKALAQETPVILLDEPTAFLDFPSKVEIMLLLREIARKQGKAIFLSTHDMETALQISDRMWLLDRNHGLTVGSTSDLMATDTIGRYFDSPHLRFDPVTTHFRINP